MTNKLAKAMGFKRCVVKEHGWVYKDSNDNAITYWDGTDLDVKDVIEGIMMGTMYLCKGEVEKALLKL